MPILMLPEERPTSEIPYHSDLAPGRRFVFVGRQIDPRCTFYVVGREVADVPDDQPEWLKDHRHNCNTFYLYMGDQPDLSGLYASVTVEGHSFEVKSPAAVLVPANTLHHYKLTGGSGWYFHVNLRCDYEDSLSEPDSVDPSQVPDVDVSAIYKTGIKGPDTESESSLWSFVDDRFSKPGIHIRVYQIGSEMQDEIHRVFERGDGASLPVAAPGESLEVEVQSGDHFVKGISPATIYHSGGDAFTYRQIQGTGLIVEAELRMDPELRK